MKRLLLDILIASTLIYTGLWLRSNQTNTAALDNGAIKFVPMKLGIECTDVYKRDTLTTCDTDSECEGID